ncbi:GNAT family N-acetyltransferase [Shouchella patagoniensis]|uniref:GNAT family N-acetyltransferase n=1 Tax=Shouchella patagoniensis TaxID=228576 RepID=UPI000994AA87|nr:GNAT family N-acetyltransferase [Shouchella patagoniensis]
MNDVMSIALAVKLEQSETEMLSSRMQAFKKIAGNPMGVEICSFGNTIAFLAKMMPGPAFNTVRGLGIDDIDKIVTIINHYDSKKISPQFVINPAQVSKELCFELSRNSLCQTSFHSMLYGSIDQCMGQHTNKSIVCRKLGKNEFDLYAEIYINSFGMPTSLQEGVAQNNSVLSDEEQWQFFIAEWNGEPAGVAVVFTDKSIAVLASAATLPEYRGRGIHRELIQARLEHVFLKGYRLISGQAAFGSTSQKNMERAGMKIAYTKSIWTEITKKDHLL